MQGAQQPQQRFVHDHVPEVARVPHDVCGCGEPRPVDVRQEASRPWGWGGGAHHAATGREAARDSVGGSAWGRTHGQSPAPSVPFVLVGLDAIGRAVGAGQGAVKRWIREDGFPARRCSDGTYRADPEAVRRWFWGEHEAAPHGALPTGYPARTPPDGGARHGRRDGPTRGH